MRKQVLDYHASSSERNFNGFRPAQLMVHGLVAYFALMFVIIPIGHGVVIIGVLLIFGNPSAYGYNQSSVGASLILIFLGGFVGLRQPLVAILLFLVSALGGFANCLHLIYLSDFPVLSATSALPYLACLVFHIFKIAQSFGQLRGR